MESTIYTIRFVIKHCRARVDYLLSFIVNWNNFIQIFELSCGSTILTTAKVYFPGTRKCTVASKHW